MVYPYSPPPQLCKSLFALIFCQVFFLSITKAIRVFSINALHSHAVGERSLKIGRRGVATLLALARIVNKELRALANRAALLAVIDNHAKPARLRRSRTFFDPVDQIRPTGTD